MPKLKAVVGSLDEVSEAHRELYVEREGKFVLDADGVEDVTGLKTALQSERESNKKLKKVIGKRDPEKVAAYLEQMPDDEDDAGDGEDKGKEKSGTADKGKLEQVEKKYAKVVEQKDEVIDKQDAFIRKLLAENEATRAITEHKGNVKLLLPHVMSSVKVIENEDKPGEYVAVVLDEKGNTRITTGKGSDNMTIAELVEELKASEDFAGAFAGTGASGSGARPSGDKGREAASPSGGGTGDVMENKRRTGNYAAL